MAQDGVLGAGVKIAFSATSPVSWTEVKQVLDFDFPGLDPSEVESTTHKSARTSALRKFIRGLQDVTEMNVQLLSDLDETTGTDQETLRALQAASTTVWWRIEVPVDRARTKWKPMEFQGWVKKYQPKAPIDNKQETEISVRFDGTGLFWFAAGASAIS